jgi:high-affinity iron transporter
MFNAALIVFRETLEAALIIGIVAAATRRIPRSGLWITLGVALGLAGAVGVASVAGQIGQWANGIGHELFNASVLAIAVAMLAWHNVWMASHGRQLADDARRIGSSATTGELAISAVTIAVALTVLREGSETVLFFFGILAGAGASEVRLIEGSLLGLLAGTVAGALTYRGLLRIPVRHFFTVTAWLLLLVAAGMAAQLAQVLIQADLLSPIIQPLWDSSGIVAPDSSLGALLHALVGYEAQPSATQVAFAGIVIVVVTLASRRARRRSIKGA